MRLLKPIFHIIILLALLWSSYELIVGTIIDMGNKYEKKQKELDSLFIENKKLQLKLETTLDSIYKNLPSQ